MQAPRMSSRLVNVAEDAELRLIHLLGDYSSSLNIEECEACGDTSQLFQLILADKSSVPALVTDIQDEEAVGGFTLLVALISDDDIASSQAQVSALAKAVMDAGDASEAVCARRLKLLSVLYNLRAPVTDKLEILQKMMTVAGKFPGSFLRAQDPLGKLLVSDDENEKAATASSETGGASVSINRLALQPSVPRLVTLLDSWHTSTQQRFSVYHTIVQALETHAASDIRKQRFLLLLIECSLQNAETPAAAKDAAIGAIRDPISLFPHQRNMLNVPAIQALAKTEPLLFGLLQIFQQGKLSDYEAFLNGNGGQEAILPKWNLDATTCRRNMRILSLCSLASEHEEIPYQSIAETLRIEDASNTMQVEAQVIAAVNSGLLQAKMDQLSHKVLVERCVVRKFDIPQWKTLQTRLQSWKENVGAILAALEQAQNFTAVTTSKAASTPAN